LFHNDSQYKSEYHMAKAGLLFVGTDNGVVLYSEPGAAGRWLRIGQELRGASIAALWIDIDNPTIVLAATGTALLRSTDGGALWEPIHGVPSGLLAGSKADPAMVTCLAADGRVFRSTDAGETWLLVGSMPGTTARVLLATADNQLALYAATGNQIWASGDGGQSWIEHGRLPGIVTGIAVLPGQASMYATANGMLYQYRADNWQPIVGTPPMDGPLVVLAGREPTILAAIDSSAMGRSNDGGTTWESTSAEVGWGAGVQTLVAASYHMDTAFAGGGQSVALSVDRGRTWQRLKGDTDQVRAIAVARLV
jgi:photosystem II stability/assembly factor-like uncharacterized protein